MDNQSHRNRGERISRHREKKHEQRLTKPSKGFYFFSSTTSKRVAKNTIADAWRKE